MWRSTDTAWRQTHCAAGLSTDQDLSTTSVARRARNNLVSPLTPLRWREPANDHENSSASPINSRVDSAVNTEPGRATLVTRLATLTGLPNQSPARLTAEPEASPTRNCGKSSLSAAATRWSVASKRGAGSGDM